ncbi:MAG: TRAM domain-containing protein, partial [Clostridia bacterium]|nr:TRAM domain-containing protein [Clostridia bacterium]
IAKQNDINRTESAKYVGKTVEILCEDYDDKKDLYMGRDEFGKMAYFKSDKNVIGEFLPVKILGANGISLSGEIAEKL